jgi:hypothetical protein
MLPSPLHRAAAALALVFATAAGAAPLQLVTPAEVRQEQQAAAGAPEPPRTRSLGAPRSGTQIRIVAPNAGGAVPAPLRLEVAFEAAPGARIVPATFRVLYGVLKIDLTERLRSQARISETGMVLEQAQVPDGVHRLFMQVSDDKGNLAEQELRFRVGPAS